MAVVLCAFGAVATPFAAFSIYHKDGLTLLAGMALALGLFAFAGLLDALTTFVWLAEDELIIRSNFRRRAYPRSGFTSVTAERGCPTCLHLGSGGDVRLPGAVLVHPNTIRAWLKRSSSEPGNL